MENCFDSNQSLQCHSEYLDIYRGEYTIEKDGVNIKKDSWKRYLLVLQDVKGMYSSFMIYRRTSKNWHSETPKYKFDLTSGKFEVKALSYTRERFLFELYFEESDTRFLVSAKDENTRNLWMYWLISTRCTDPFSNTGSVYLVKVLETLDTRKFQIGGICYLYLLRDRLLLSRMSDRSLLADWPLRVVRFYASRQDLLKLELGRKAMHGEMIIYFQTNKAKEIFQIIQSSITAKTRVEPVEVKESPFVASAEYATVDLKKKAERRLQLEEAKSALALRKFQTPPPPPPSDYEPMRVNLDTVEFEKQEALPRRGSRDLIPFEAFDEYDTLQHYRSAFADSRSSSSQSDTSEGYSTSGEYSCLRNSPKSSPPHKLVTICAREKHSRDSVILDQPNYASIDSLAISPSLSSGNLIAQTQKQVVSNLWSCQSKGPAVPLFRQTQVRTRKKTSGMDEGIISALDSLTIPDNHPVIPRIEPPSKTEPSVSDNDSTKKLPTRGITRRNGTRVKNKLNKTPQSNCATEITSSGVQPMKVPNLIPVKNLAY